MKELPPRYTLRVSQMLLDKLGYIADFEGRTKNKELEQMIKSASLHLRSNTGKYRYKEQPRNAAQKGHGSPKGGRGLFYALGMHAAEMPKKGVGRRPPVHVL